MKKFINKHAKLYMIASIIVLLGAVGVTYAYYSATVSNNTSVAGEAGGGTAPTLSVDLVSEDATGNLIPIDMDKDTLTKAASANPKCIDKNGYSACQIYSVTVTNNSDIDQSYNITLSSLSGEGTPNVDAVSMGTSDSAVEDASSIKGTGNICTTNSVGKGDITDTCYFMVIIKNQNQAQTDNGTFNGTVTATSTTGSEVKADFGEGGASPVEVTPLSDFKYYIDTFKGISGLDSLIPEGQVLLEKYNGTDSDIYVPSSYVIDGVEYIPIIFSTEGASGTFMFNEYIENVHFEDGVLFAEEVQEEDENGELTGFSIFKYDTMAYMFLGCTNLLNVSGIPDSVTSMAGTFQQCTSLVNAPEIPNSVTSLFYTFYGCTSLVTAPEIPSSVTSMNATFWGCTSLVNAPEIPSSVTNMEHTFRECTSLVNAPVIPDLVTSMRCTFYGCTNLTGIVTINARGITNASSIFYNTSKSITVEVPADSTTYTTISALTTDKGMPSNVTLSTFTAS